MKIATAATKGIQILRFDSLTGSGAEMLDASSATLTADSLLGVESISI
ncbi:MAG TPA: hypothetical protein VGL53_27115 [Bryobacteraceae bacterium]